MKRAAPWLVAGLVAAGLATAWLPTALAGDGEGASRRELVEAVIVEAVGAALVEGYIFEDVAAAMRARLEERLASGAYEGGDLDALARRLTADLQGVSRDKHLRVFPLPKDRSTGKQMSAEERERFLFEEMRKINFGFVAVERLEGNVGYLDLRKFADTSIGRQAAVEAMRSLAGADALIFDLRRNTGGSPRMIELLTGYLFDEPVLLNTIYTRRTGAREELWSAAEVEGERLSAVPVYILTSGTTFSAAEAFAYCLQNLGRATVVGEVTGGGAHRVTVVPWPEWGLAMSVPYTRPIHPVTGTDWEGTGVQPDIAVPAADALSAAHRAALAELERSQG